MKIDKDNNDREMERKSNCQIMRKKYIERKKDIYIQGSFLALDIIGHMTCCQKNQSVILKNNRS